MANLTIFLTNFLLSRVYVRAISVLLWAIALALVISIRLLGSSYWILALAYFFLTIALLVSAGCSLKSQPLIKVPRSRNRTRHGTRNRRKWGTSTALLALFILLVVITESMWRNEETRGFLFPGHISSPPSTCGTTPANAIAIYLGTIVSIVPKDRFPHTVLSINGHDRIILKRRWDGALAISADLYDIRGKKIGEVSDNEPVLVGAGALRIEHDRSALAVKDRQGLELLRLNYLNPSAIQLEAFLFSPNVGPLQIKGDTTQAPCLHSPDGAPEFRVNVAGLDR